MEYGFYLTVGQTAAVAVLLVMMGTLVMLACSAAISAHRSERRDEDVRHRSSEQNTDL